MILSAMASGAAASVCAWDGTFPGLKYGTHQATSMSGGGVQLQIVYQY
jgi:hypothetical protein